MILQLAKEELQDVKVQRSNKRSIQATRFWTNVPFFYIVIFFTVW